MNKKVLGIATLPAGGSYFPRATMRKNSGGLVQMPPQGARTSQKPGPNVGKRGTEK